MNEKRKLIKLYQNSHFEQLSKMLKKVKEGEYPCKDMDCFLCVFGERNSTSGAACSSYGNLKGSHWDHVGDMKTFINNTIKNLGPTDEKIKEIAALEEFKKLLDEQIVQQDDRVWIFGRGWGTVADPMYNGKHIVVDLDNKDRVYLDLEGRVNNNGTRVIFFEEIPIQESAYKRRRWRSAPGNNFIMINHLGGLEKVKENGDKYCNDLYEVGNYFKNKKEAYHSEISKGFKKHLEDTNIVEVK